MLAKLLAVVVIGGFAGASLILYLLPVLIGWARRVPDIGAVAVIDILLGWTFLGWVLALAMALRSVPSPGPAVTVIQHPPAPPPSPAPPAGPGAGWAGPPGPPPPRPQAPPPLVLPPHPAGRHAAPTSPDQAGQP